MCMFVDFFSWYIGPPNYVHCCDFYSHGSFEPSSKRWRILGMKSLMGTLREEKVGIFTCHVLKSHSFKALVVQLSHLALKFWNVTWKILIARFSRRHEDAYAYIYDVSCQSAFFDYLSYFASQIWRTPHRITCSQAHYGLSTMVLPTYPPLG